MSCSSIARGGIYLRVADPSWDDPLDGTYSMVSGGRWNPPGAFPVVYLCSDVRVARGIVFAKYEGLPYGPEDLEPGEAPILVSTDTPHDDYLDAVTDGGLGAVGLPATYPRDDRGDVIPHPVCQPIGERAWQDGCPGIACRSAVLKTAEDGEDLAFFPRATPLSPTGVQAFSAWF